MRYGVFRFISAFVFPVLILLTSICFPELSFAGAGITYQIPENEVNAIIVPEDKVKALLEKDDAKSTSTPKSNITASSAALPNERFEGWYRYPPEERYWLQMINNTAYFRDVFAGGAAYLHGENNGERWSAVIILPDGTQYIFYPIIYYEKWYWYEKCFVSFLPRWAVCDAESITVIWYAASQCKPTGQWTMDFYNDGNMFYSGQFTLLPEINPLKTTEVGVTLLNQLAYSDIYDSICVGPVDPLTREPKSVPCDEKHTKPWTISQKGCYLVDTAMIINYHGMGLRPPKSIIPAELNMWLIANAGYDPAGNVYPGKVAKYAVQKGINVSFEGWHTTGELEGLICKYGPQMTGVKIDPTGRPGHWVTATGRNAAKTTYKINDPLGGAITTIDAKYGNRHAQVRAFRGPEHRFKDDRSMITIRFYSPGELLLIDPEGRKLGYDPVKGISYDEIPGGAYEKWHQHDDVTGGVGELSTELGINPGYPVVGDYVVNVIGTGTGTYGLEIDTVDINSDDIGRRTFSNIPITLGKIDSYGFYFGKMPGTQLNVFGGFDGRGQRPTDVNKFLSYISPSKSQTELPLGVNSFALRISYDKNILSSTFAAKLNGVDISAKFNPAPGTLETVTLELSSGRNTLVLEVEGNLPNRVARDSDRLVFIVP